MWWHVLAYVTDRKEKCTVVEKEWCMRVNEAERLDQRENQGERSQEMEGSDCLQKECIATYEALLLIQWRLTSLFQNRRVSLCDCVLGTCISSLSQSCSWCIAEDLRLETTCFLVMYVHVYNGRGRLREHVRKCSWKEIQNQLLRGLWKFCTTFQAFLNVVGTSVKWLQSVLVP